MIKIKSPDKIHEYEGEKNVIVFPITKFVKKDGNLTVTNESAVYLLNKYHNLPKKWGYMIDSGIPFPSYSNSKTNLIGIPDREHYASTQNQEYITTGMWYIKEESLVKFDYVFYLVGFSGDFLDEIFKESKNVILLETEG